MWFCPLPAASTEAALECPAEGAHLADPSPHHLHLPSPLHSAAVRLAQPGGCLLPHSLSLPPSLPLSLPPSLPPFLSPSPSPSLPLSPSLPPSLSLRPFIFPCLYFLRHHFAFCISPSMKVNFFYCSCYMYNPTTLSTCSVLVLFLDFFPPLSLSSSHRVCRPRSRA